MKFEWCARSSWHSKTGFISVGLIRELNSNSATASFIMYHSLIRNKQGTPETFSQFLIMYDSEIITNSLNNEISYLLFV